jgi:tRNA nucleotidyltransferase (CCA-adding enzyme)
MICLPHGVVFVIQKLESAGFEAWAVGGCVRDSLLDLTPHDWDVCTNARPEQTLAVFAGRRVIETGIKHGTVTVLLDNIAYEVTTYRTDGVYLDSRHPDSVSFVANLKEDLSRRDFTVNAMAYHPIRGLYDDFGGAEDLKNKIIRCVGDPSLRFTEDALRIMRALRFSAAYGFSIEEKTAQALLDLKDHLLLIAPERIREELMRLITGAGAAFVLREYAPVIFAVLPELAPMHNHAQFNPYHHLDIWEHTLQTVNAVPPEPALRLAMLLHDAGKPACYFRDEKGVGHFYGHPKESLKLTVEIMTRLRFDNQTCQTVEELVLHHDATIPAKNKNVLHWLNRIGETRLRQLVLVMRADALAQHPDKRESKLRDIDALEGCLQLVVQKKLPYRLKDLAITGTDLKTIGIAPGPQVGRILNTLLDHVMDGELPNEKEALLKAVQKGSE